MPGDHLLSNPLMEMSRLVDWLSLEKAAVKSMATGGADELLRPEQQPHLPVSLGVFV